MVGVFCLYIFALVAYRYEIVFRIGYYRYENGYTDSGGIRGGRLVGYLSINFRFILELMSVWWELSIVGAS